MKTLENCDYHFANSMEISLEGIHLKAFDSEGVEIRRKLDDKCLDSFVVEWLKARQESPACHATLLDEKGDRWVVPRKMMNLWISQIAQVKTDLQLTSSRA